jgi:hypothetical protein
VVDKKAESRKKAETLFKDLPVKSKQTAPVVEKPKPKSGASDAQRIVENSQKPRSPTEVGKSAQPTGTEYLKSIQGKQEFREYRQKVLRGEA